MAKLEAEKNQLSAKVKALEESNSQMASEEGGINEQLAHRPMAW